MTRASCLRCVCAAGELARLCEPPLSSPWAHVRAAAVTALGSVLLIPDVMRAAAASAGMANQTNDHWSSVADALLDEEEDVVAAAVAVVRQLLQVSLSEGIMGRPGAKLQTDSSKALRLLVAREQRLQGMRQTRAWVWQCTT